MRIEGPCFTCGREKMWSYACTAPACSRHNKKVCKNCLEADGVKFRIRGIATVELDDQRCAAGVTCPACGKGRLRDVNN